MGYLRTPSIWLLGSQVASSLNMTPIVPVPQKSRVTCLNDHHMVAYISTIIKCLVMMLIISCFRNILNPLQFAYCHHRSTAFAMSLTLHSTLEHLYNRNRYVRLQFIFYNTVFNTIIPFKLITKLRDLGLCTSLCKLILPHKQISIGVVPLFVFLDDLMMLLKICGILTHSMKPNAAII